jgi:hypothetical protein
MSPAEIDEGTPVSVKIRERIKAARKRFNANDNIADFIEPGDLEKMLDEVTVKMQGVLDSLVIDTDNDHNTSIPRAGWPRCMSTRCSGAATCTLPASRSFPMPST